MTQESQAGDSTRSEQFAKVCGILAEYNYQPEKLIPVLQKIQEVYRYLPEGIIQYVAASLKIPVAHVYGVATFYSHFTLEPKGKYLIRCCNGTACHVKESLPIYNALRDKLKIPEGKNTSSDLLFTIETVSCLGACGLAPVLVINDEVRGQMTPARAVALIDEILKKESGNE